ncbi:MAG: adenylate kinase [Candidatus Dojkabacteria bacterium]|nr:MAG: adenylate kinase [Candidatus Dojkabacteria bacterium]
MTILFLGLSGSGKDTQAELLAEKLGNATVISTGEILRQVAKSGEGELANKIKSYLDKGLWVPDELVYEILGNHLKKITYKHIFLSGAVRTSSQVALLDNELEKLQRPLEMVIILDVSREEVFKRLIARGRSDDEVEIIENRIKEFEKNISPILEIYEKRGILFRVDGNRSIQAIHEDILDIIKKHYDVNFS